MKVSVIVPVYNTEMYLRQCLDSLINQTLKEIEIICVDNGSTDNSFDILKEYEARNKNIKVLNHHDGRQGAARNAGIKVAQGSYIGFVDSDDYVSSQMFEKMYASAMKYESDVVVCDRYIYYNKINKVELNNTLGQLSSNLEVFNILENLNLFRCLTICDKIIARDFLIKHKLSFPEDHYHEDLLLVAKSFILATKISAVFEPLYYYRKQRLGSVSEDRSRSAFDIFVSMGKLENFLRQSDLFEKYKFIFSEIKIKRYLDIFPQVNRYNIRDYYKQMLGEFQYLNLQDDLEILTLRDYNNYRVVRDKSFFINVVILKAKKLLGKLLLNPYIKKIYLTIRRRSDISAGLKAGER